MTNAADSSLVDASRLVRAAQLDRMFVIGLVDVMSLGRNIEDSEFKKYYDECIVATNPALFTDILAQRYAKDMSTEQIKEATRFFESEVGKKSTQRSVLQAYQSFGLRMEEPKRALSSKENAQVEVFTSSVTGRIFIRNRANDPGSTSREVVMKAREIVRQCAKVSTERKERERTNPQKK